MAEIKENDLNWPSVDILVSYDSKNDRVVFSKLSTGDVLRVFPLDSPEVLQICGSPFAAQEWTPVPRWRSLLNRLLHWIRSL